MTSITSKTENTEGAVAEYVTAMIGGQLFGLPISRVQDVFMPERLTRVPLSPGEIAGVLNLRGRIVTVIDGPPHTLAFLGSITGTATTCLGVSVFGQGGGMDEVHACHGLNARSIVEAALDLVD